MYLYAIALSFQKTGIAKVAIAEVAKAPISAPVDNIRKYWNKECAAGLLIWELKGCVYIAKKMQDVQVKIVEDTVNNHHSWA